MDDDTKTITWMDACGRIASLTVPADVAEKIANGDRVSWYGDQEPTRQTKDEALKQIRDERAGPLARKDQVEAERDALVDRYPELKSAPRSLPSDDAA